MKYCFIQAQMQCTIVLIVNLTINKYVVLTKIKTDFAYLIYLVKTREEHRMDEEAAPRKLINWAALKEQSDKIRDTKFAGDDANTFPTE